MTTTVVARVLHVHYYIDIYINMSLAEWWSTLSVVSALSLLKTTCMTPHPHILLRGCVMLWDDIYINTSLER